MAATSIEWRALRWLEAAAKLQGQPADSAVPCKGALQPPEVTAVALPGMCGEGLFSVKSRPGSWAGLVGGSAIQALQVCKDARTESA